jgi:hypothetical protein
VVVGLHCNEILVKLLGTGLAESFMTVAGLHDQNAQQSVWLVRTRHLLGTYQNHRESEVASRRIFQMHSDIWPADLTYAVALFRNMHGDFLSNRIMVNNSVFASL